MRLSDKYTVERGNVYLTGIQALVRLPMDQMRRDRRAGLNTAAFISGYEGSPLGGYDLAAGARRKLLDAAQHPLPARRERGSGRDLGHGQPDLRGGREKRKSTAWSASGTAKGRESTAPAIFSATRIWPAPGKTARRWCSRGDDHSCKSSTIPHQSDFSLYNLGIPFLYPGNTQEIIDYGLLAIALSRFSGAWVGLKLVTDVCDGGGTVTVDPDRPAIRLPEGYQKTRRRAAGPAGHARAGTRGERAALAGRASSSRA